MTRRIVLRTVVLLGFLCADAGKGRSIRLPETPAYGCSVKYQS